MSISIKSVIFLLFFVLILGAKQAEAAGMDVLLSVQNTSAVGRHFSPITSGVPLPQKASVTSVQQLQLTNDRGVAIPAQFTVLARWGGKAGDTSKPIKWVLVDFVAKKIRANSTTRYHLQTGTSNRLPGQTVKIKKNNNVLTVKTGAATFELNTTRFNLFQQVFLEPNHTPLLADGKQLGAVATSNQQQYSASNGTIQTAKVEQRGPIHSVVLVQGWQADRNGGKLLAYTARLHFYAGQSYVRVHYGVWNDNVMRNVNGQPDIKEFGSPHTVRFSDMTLYTQLADRNNWSYRMGDVGKKYWQGELNEKAELYQDSSGGTEWHSGPNTSTTTFRGFTARVDEQTLHDACDTNDASEQCRALGWLDLTSPQGGLAVGVRDFWQNFPKNLVAKNDGSVAVKLFPEEYNTDFELRVGERKTHEVMYYFHPSKNNAKQIAHTMYNLHYPLMATAAAKWYLQDTGAFQSSVPYNKNKFSAYEGYNDAAITYKDANLFLLQDGISDTNWVYGDRPESLGWRHFGDRIAEDETSPNNYPVFTNQQYDHPWYFVYQFIRTLDTNGKRPQLWWQLARPAVWQQSDMDIIHSRCTGKSEADMRKCMDPNTPIAVGWAMGGRLTNQWHSDPSINVDRHALIDTWSGGVRGMVYYWYLTGDPVARDGWRELTRNMYWRVNNTPCNDNPKGDCGPGYAQVNPNIENAEWARGGAYAIEILTDAADATGQEQYLKAAHEAIVDMNPKDAWFADPNFTLNSSAAKTGKTMSPWAMGMVLKSIGYYLDTYKTHTGKVDVTAQDVLLRYATIASHLWQLNTGEVSQYLVYETGGHVPESNDPMQIALADGLVWALDYDDGRLDRNRVSAVADEAFQRGSQPWGNYADNTFMSTKTHVIMGISGWRYMRYALGK